MTKDIHEYVLSLYIPFSKLTLLAEKSTIKLWDDLGIGGFQKQAMSVCWRIPWKLVAILWGRVKSPQIAFLFVQVNPQPKWPNISWNSKVKVLKCCFVGSSRWNMLYRSYIACHKCLSACVYWLLERLDWWAVSNSHFPFPWWWW